MTCDKIISWERHKFSPKKNFACRKYGVQIYQGKTVIPCSFTCLNFISVGDPGI